MLCRAYLAYLDYALRRARQLRLEAFIPISSLPSRSITRPTLICLVREESPLGKAQE